MLTFQNLGITTKLELLNNNNVLSTFVEAYLQEMGASDADPIEVRRKNITSILLALFGWSVSDRPGMDSEV